MARLERPKSTGSNPAKKFLEWKSDAKAFAYYDKDKGENVEVPLPFKFLFLEHYHTVKGWHDATGKGIYSNEVFAIGSEPITVKTFGGLEIASGLYKDIKPKIAQAGGRYCRSVYVMLEDGSIANITLKGAAQGGLKKENSATKQDVDGYSEFYKKHQHLLDNQWITVNQAIDAKKGATKYSIPLFEVGEVIDRATDEAANVAANTLQDYINEYRKSSVEAERQPEPVDDLDF